MLIQHLDALGTQGLDQSIELSLIEVRFDRTLVKSSKLEVGYDIVRKAAGTKVMFYSVDKIDPANYLPASPKAREAILQEPTPRCFRGIPVNKGRTQTSSLVKLLALLYRSAWYRSQIDAGILDAVDANARIATLPDPLDLKNTVAENKKSESGAQLPIIGKTAGGFVVLGLKRSAQLPEVDIQTSIELTKQILLIDAETEPEENSGKGFDEINFELQTKSGRARNLYGKEQDIAKLVSVSPAETARVYGLYDPIDVQAVREQYVQLARYPVKVGENPDRAHLFFIPLRSQDTELVRATVQQARQNLILAKEKKKKKAKDAEVDSVEHKTQLLPLIRRRLKAKVLLGNLEGTQKTFLLLNQVFPSVPLYYWQILNEDLPRIQWRLIDFNKTYRSGPLAQLSPSSYSLWTKVFTKALNREHFDPYLVWRHWAGFLKNLANKDIIGDAQAKMWPKALHPIQLISQLTYLNNLIEVVQNETNLDLDAPQIREKANGMKSHPTKTDTEALVGPIWNDLYDWQRDLAHKAHVDVTDGIPEKELPLYLKGVVTGILLNSLVRQFAKEGINRRFDYSAGMHLTNVRGKNLISRFKQGLNLYNGLNKTQKSQIFFPFSALSHIDGMLQISKTQPFNNGLLTGIVIRSSGAKDVQTTEATEPESTPASA